MELTEGILKAIDSGVQVSGESSPMFLLKYKGKIFNQGGNKVRLYANEGAAKRTITDFVKQVFWHGGYWQSCAKQIKARTGYDVDFSATLNILPFHGATSRYDDPKNKKMFKSIGEELLKQGIFTIEKV
jgi:hypothetical protein